MKHILPLIVAVVLALAGATASAQTPVDFKVTAISATQATLSWQTTSETTYLNIWSLDRPVVPYVGDATPGVMNTLTIDAVEGERFTIREYKMGDNTQLVMVRFFDTTSQPVPHFTPPTPAPGHRIYVPIALR